jgi:hypothetical protein
MLALGDAQMSAKPTIPIVNKLPSFLFFVVAAIPAVRSTAVALMAGHAGSKRQALAAKPSRAEQKQYVFFLKKCQFGPKSQPWNSSVIMPIRKSFSSGCELSKKKPKHTFLVHGEPEAANRLPQTISSQLGWSVEIAHRLEKVSLG